MSRCCCCCCVNRGNTNNDTNTGNTGANPVGTIIYAHILQPGYVKTDGQLLSRKDFPDLYKYADENNLVLGESEWVDAMRGMFAEGDGVNTFRVPDLSGQFLRGLDEAAGVDVDRMLGSVQGDAIRNITGKLSVRTSNSKTQDDYGAFYYSHEYAPGAGAQGNVVAYLDGFDASLVVPIAEENRPKNIALIAQIKY